ncbi:ribonuclease P protein component [Algimonas porphyrae]|uniref:Ribonuclease P protein component n=1 Tax=Algimonas porphyrae TaxID=1128113 RepID=A0ABQ5V3Y7_9PROT|nr:ribonuclease P protein component [Algimonas porphyrae]GLQ21692.1 hypothetical protein GCM10007854_26470 [Algimonas porphyrae]
MTHNQDIELGALTKRSEFLYVREGDYAARGAIVVQCRANADHQVIRYGVTATKRIGNAVIRNRAKRRLRVIARELLPELGHAGHDYVLIARDRTPIRDWKRLQQDARRALQSVPSPGQSPTQDNRHKNR